MWDALGCTPRGEGGLYLMLTPWSFKGPGEGTSLNSWHIGTTLIMTLSASISFQNFKRSELAGRWCYKLPDTCYTSCLHSKCVKTNIKVKVVAWNNDPTTPSDSWKIFLHLHLQPISQSIPAFIFKIKKRTHKASCLVFEIHLKMPQVVQHPVAFIVFRLFIFNGITTSASCDGSIEVASVIN